MIIAAITRHGVASYVEKVFYVYIIMLFAYLLLSMLFTFGARPSYALWTDAVMRFLRDVSEPYLRLFRKIIPPIGAVDLSPMLAIIVLFVLEQIIYKLID